MIELLTLGLIGLFFICLYIREKNDLHKIIFLISGLSIIMTGFFTNFILAQTIITPVLSTITTNYIYSRNDNLTQIGVGFGGVFIIIMLLFAYRILKEVLKISGWIGE